MTLKSLTTSTVGYPINSWAFAFFFISQSQTLLAIIEVTTQLRVKTFEL